jgi:hypothetical protein
VEPLHVTVGWVQEADTLVYVPPVDSYPDQLGEGAGSGNGLEGAAALSNQTEALMPPVQFTQPPAFADGRQLMV